MTAHGRLGRIPSLVWFSVAALAACSPPAQNTEAPDVSAAAQVVEKGGQEEFGPYEPVADWPRPLPDRGDGLSHDGWTWGSMGGIFAESPDRIWVAMRGELPLPPGNDPWTPYALVRPFQGNSTGNDDGMSATCQPTTPRGWERRYHHTIFVLDGDGNLVEDWPHADALFDVPCGRGPHQIMISPYDPERHVWIVDDQLHVIYKFTHDGELVMTLGTKGQRGRDAGRLFDRPTDVAWLPDGTFFIADGYGGTRVAKFDKDGNFLMDWGQPAVDRANPGPNEFNTVHAVAVDANRRVYVADRGYGRVQIFDENGTFLDMWPIRRPLDLLMSADQHLWVTDLDTSRILKYDLNGQYLYGWGSKGAWPGAFGCPHQISVDSDNNVYVAECFNGRIQKFQPKANADPAKFIGAPLPLMGE